MHDIPPASMARSNRTIARVFPVGQRDGAPLLIAVCDDGSIWQLDQRGWFPEWEQLPAIPLVAGAT